MKLFLALLLLVGCATTESQEITEPHLAKWCFDEDPTQNCLLQKSFQDPLECMLFIVDAPKLYKKGYWACQLDPSKGW